MPTTQPYEEYITFETTLANQPIHVVSKPGIPDWDHIAPSVQLLAKYLSLSPQERMLLLGCGNGALSIILSRQIRPSALQLHDDNIIALECTRRTLEANNLAAQSTDLVTDLAYPRMAPLSTIVLLLPKGRFLARRWLLASYESLQTGGRLYIAGANDQGIQPFIKDAENIFGASSLLGYKKGCRAVRLIKPEFPATLPAWTEQPGLLPGSWISFSINLGWTAFNIHSLPGVFSSDQLDEGSALLLDVLRQQSHAWISPESRVVDIGCGYGILGLAATRLGAARVDMVDSSLSAVAATQENIVLNHIPQAQVFASDLLTAVSDCRYHLAISNPPFHSGKGVDYNITQALIRQASQALLPRGHLIIVANRFIRYEHEMKAWFNRVEVLAETNKFRVLSGIK